MDARAAGLLAFSNIVGGSSYVATAEALKGFDSFSLVLLRVGGAALLFLPVLVKRWPRQARGEDWLRMAAVGVLGYAAPLWVGTVGQGMSNSTSAALLVGVEPVSVVMLSVLALGERLNLLKGAAFVCALSGAALIAGQGLPRMGELSLQMRGDLLLAFHGVLWSLYTVIGKRALERVDALAFTAVTNLIGCVALALLVPFVGLSAPSGPPAALAAWLYLTVLVSFGATLCWNWGLEKVPAASVAPFIFLQPLFGAVLGVLHGEPMTAWTAAGGALIIAGVGLTLKA